MKRFFSVFAILLVYLAILSSILVVAHLYGYAHQTYLENNVVISAGKVDLLSLTTTRYRRTYFLDSLYEDVIAYSILKDRTHYGFKNGELDAVSVGNNHINNPVELLKYEKEAKELLLVIRERFSDIMPLQ